MMWAFLQVLKSLSYIQSETDRQSLVSPCHQGGDKSQASVQICRQYISFHSHGDKRRVSQLVYGDNACLLAIQAQPCHHSQGEPRGKLPDCVTTVYPY